ncbi:hypothetical protein B0G76_4946 [Paraburkholderia sp. BL23I1N1]|uniref:hypothetical protein n=1 Tax=Paraburkholderia sp. BL23I1N1 TaxID=1938802 RepID=UPI000FEDE8A5|nr:hypothetical protein [Paraburkholderia sp. BL23I1N1]RKE38613.1 hypothetical protein B0G76_4946 [Paraburkholderia sp. BL23I1N1]
MTDVEKAAQVYALAALQKRGIGVEDEFEAFASLVPPSEAMAFAMLIGRYVTHAIVVNSLRLAPPVPSIFEE